MKNFHPKISILIPTLNAATYLEQCLKSIRAQIYPQEKIEIIIADGGSKDKTINIAKQYNCKIFSNPLKTGEAGKALALSHASGKYVALIDSDNILPEKDFITRSLEPFIRNSLIVGSEPLYFTYRPKAGFIERYSSLIGANDPYAYFCGIYDRYSYLSKKWTGLKIPTVDKISYLEIKLLPHISHPTIGANGTFFKLVFLKRNLRNSPYLFDIDIINRSDTPIIFAKTKMSIIHSFCESSITKFIRKQQRRIRDYYYYQPYRKHQWSSNNSHFALKFALYTVTGVLPLIDSIKGYLNKPDLAWFFHPLACLISLITYASITLNHHIGLKIQTSRENWRQ